VNCQTQELVVHPVAAPTRLTEDQTAALILYLRRLFCGACHGTGFDPDTLDGRCEYCNMDHPF
jgi:hypothetical protein